MTARSPAKWPRLVLITDRHVAAPRSLAEVIAEALAAIPRGSAAVQLREKDLSAAELLALARALVPLADARGCPLLVNDRLDLALAAPAAGVHLPEAGFEVAAARSLAGPRPFLIGASVHSARAAAIRAGEGADWIQLGPIWATPSKARYGAPLGEGELERAAVAVGDRARVYAVGGIDGPERAAKARRAGAHGVAVIRAIMAARDPGAAAKALVDAMCGG